MIWSSIPCSRVPRQCFENPALGGGLSFNIHPSTFYFFALIRTFEDVSDANSPYFRGTIVLGQAKCVWAVCFVLNESVGPQRKSNIRFVATLRVNKRTLKISKLFKWFFFPIMAPTEGHQQFFPHVFHFDRDCEHDDSVYFTFVSVFNTVTLPIHLSGHFTYMVTYSVILQQLSLSFLTLVIKLFSTLCIGRETLIWSFFLIQPLAARSVRVIRS